MTFGKSRPPLVPDPGQRVLLLSEDGSRIEGFRAVSGPITTETGGIIIRVAIEEEYRDSTEGGPPRRKHGMARRDGGSVRALVQVAAVVYEVALHEARLRFQTRLRRLSAVAGP